MNERIMPRESADQGVWIGGTIACFRGIKPSIGRKERFDRAEEH